MDRWWCVTNQVRLAVQFVMTFLCIEDMIGAAGLLFGNSHLTASIGRDHANAVV